MTITIDGDPGEWQDISPRNRKNKPTNSKAAGKLLADEQPRLDPLDPGEFDTPGFSAADGTLPIDQDEQRYIPLGKIHPWPGNPRKTFDDEKLAELARSITAKGVLQAIIVRPRPLPGRMFAAREQYEIAAGERRWRAASLAGLKVIPATVRNLTDRDMLEIAVIENEEREDVLPLEKAEGYQGLLDTGYTIEDLATRVGKSVSAIRGVLRLRDLPANARQALADGVIPASVAELIASRPSVEMRQKVADYALREVKRWDHGEKVKELPSYRDVKHWIREECMIELKQAPFSTAESGLAGADACTVCPKRSGNNKVDYPDARADLCTDPACFRVKADAWTKRAEALAKESGSKVLSAKESKKLFPYTYSDNLTHNAPYVDLAACCYEDKKRRNYDAILKKHIEPADVALARDQQGRLHRLVKKATAEKLLKEKCNIKKESHGGYRANPADIAKRALENAIEREAQSMFIAAAVDRVESWFARYDVVRIDADMIGLLRFVAVGSVQGLWGNHLGKILRRRNIKAKGSTEQKKKLADEIECYDFKQLLILLAEVLCYKDVFGWGSAETRGELEKLFDVFLKTCKHNAGVKVRAAKGGKSNDDDVKVRAAKGGKSNDDDDLPEEEED